MRDHCEHTSDVRASAEVKAPSSAFLPHGSWHGTTRMYAGLIDARRLSLSHAAVEASAEKIVLAAAGLGPAHNFARRGCSETSPTCCTASRLPPKAGAAVSLPCCRYARIRAVPTAHDSGPRMSIGSSAPPLPRFEEASRSLSDLWCRLRRGTVLSSETYIPGSTTPKGTQPLCSRHV